MTRKKLIILVTAVAVVLTATVFVLNDPLAPVPTIPFGRVIRVGTTYNIPPLHYNATSFRLYYDEAIFGNFTASRGTTLYIMTESQFESFSSNGAPNSFVYTTGNVTVDELGTRLGPGTYYLVFYNANSALPSQVGITRDFTTG